MRPHIETFFDPATSTASYLVIDPATKAAAIIDPVLDFEPKAARLSTASADRMLAAVRSSGLKLTYVLETHAHADHLTAADYIRRRTGATIAIGARIVEVPDSWPSRCRSSSSRSSRPTMWPPMAASSITSWRKGTPSRSET
jgi:glyoxylase-like metal-dependent hydrolase (beta-lactamase superfamily II)